MTTPREEENFLPSMVRNSELTTSVGSASVPRGPAVPPREPSPSYPSRIDGQITEWNVTLSLPMK